jgi:hypothetical protein
MGEYSMTMDELIADWKNMRAALIAQLHLVESGKLGDAANIIAGLRRAISELDALIKGQSR